MAFSEAHHGGFSPSTPVFSPQSWLGREFSDFSIWHFLKLVTGGFLQVLRFSPLSLGWGLNFQTLVIVYGIFWSSSWGIFSRYSGFLPSFFGQWLIQKDRAVIYLLTYAHHSQWSIGHQRPPAIALCSGLLLSFWTSWSPAVSALLQCLTSNCCEAGLSSSSCNECDLNSVKVKAELSLPTKWRTTYCRWYT